MPKHKSSKKHSSPETDQKVDYALTGEDHHAPMPRDNLMSYIKDVTKFKQDIGAWNGTGLDQIMENEIANLKLACGVLRDNPLLRAKIGDDFEALAVLLPRVRNRLTEREI